MKKTAQDKGVRLNYGKRAKVPHFVRGMILVPCDDHLNCTILVPNTESEPLTVFSNLRLAERAVERTWKHGDPEDMPYFDIQQVI